jgi:flagellin-specific chaperone FliS
MKKIKVVNKDKIVDKGKEIYEGIKATLEPEHKGEIVAIEVTIGDYFIGKDVTSADRKAREKYPDEVFYLAKIGYNAVWHFR